MNTSCVEVNCDDKIIILDSGTGIMSLGYDIMTGGIVKENNKKRFIFFLAMFIGVIYRVFLFFDRLLILSLRLIFTVHYTTILILNRHCVAR